MPENELAAASADAPGSGPAARLIKVASVAEKVIVQLSEKLAIVAMLVLTGMVLFTTTDVVLRFFFNKPISEVYELTGFMMLICGCLTLAWCALNDQHVKVEILVGRFNPRVRAVLSTVNHLVVLGVCFLLARESFVIGMFMKERGDHPTLLDVPYFPFYFIITLGAGLLFLVMLIRLVRSIRKVVKP